MLRRLEWRNTSVPWPRLIAVAPLFALVCGADRASADAVCRRIAPLRQISGVQWYADEAGSVIDKEKRREHEAALRPLYDMMFLVSKASDDALEYGPPHPANACAVANLTAWSNAGALLTTPRMGFNLAEQTIAVVGLNLAALKLQKAEQPLPREIEAWIGAATDTIVNTYKTGKQRANLYAWAGVAAATNDILLRRQHHFDFHDGVWRESLKKIRPDGFVDAELARRSRALIYHNSLRGALVILKRARSMLNLPVKVDELIALARLESVVNEGACDDERFVAMANAKQEQLGPWEVALGTHLALAGKSAQWASCTTAPPRFSSPIAGGRYDLSSSIFD